MLLAKFDGSVFTGFRNLHFCCRFFSMDRAFETNYYFNNSTFSLLLVYYFSYEDYQFRGFDSIPQIDVILLHDREIIMSYGQDNLYYIFLSNLGSKFLSSYKKVSRTTGYFYLLGMSKYCL